MRVTTRGHGVYVEIVEAPIIMRTYKGRDMNNKQGALHAYVVIYDSYSSRYSDQHTLPAGWVIA